MGVGAVLIPVNHITLFQIDVTGGRAGSTIFTVAIRHFGHLLNTFYEKIFVFDGGWRIPFWFWRLRADEHGFHGHRG
jgi:hypothetical protein